ncbi:COMM domain-containing protein 8 [Menidia menidia]
MVDALSRVPDADCLRLCHRVVDGLCGREPPRPEDFGATWSLQEWLQLQGAMATLFRQAVGGGLSEEEVRDRLSPVGGGHVEAVLSALRSRRDEIRRALLNRTDAMASAMLQDFDWQLKLALSSDKISSLNTPLLGLSLDVRQDGVLRPVAMEMSREELAALIASLEAANKVVLQLK